MHAQPVLDATATPDAATAIARAPTVLRLAGQLAGDPDAAVAATCEVLSRGRRLRQPADGVDDEALLCDLVRTALRRRPSHVGEPHSPLDELSVPQRVATVLAFGQGWDPDGVAEAMRSTRRRVRRHVRHALELGPEAAWRRLLCSPDWDLTPPADIADRCREAARRRSVRRSHRLLAAAAATVTLVGAAVTVDRVVNAPGPFPPTAHSARLLPWPARGELVRDRALVAAAVAAWRRQVVPVGVRRRAFVPADRAYVLYAGRVDGARLVVLQALTAGDDAEVAVVAEQGAPSGRPRLRLTFVAPLAHADVPMLAIPDPGSRDRPGQEGGPGSRFERVLVAPGVDRIEYRAVLNDSAAPDGLLRFSTGRLTRGLSDPWPDRTGAEPATAVRAYRGAQRVFTGLLTAGGVQPVPIAPRIAPAPGAWPARHVSIDRATLHGDAVWWAQFCQRPDPLVQPAWAGGAPMLTTALRMEFVRCTPASLVVGFLTGPGAAPTLVDTATGPADVYTARIRSPGNPRPSAVVAVGSVRVSRILVGRDYAAHGQVAAVSVGGTPPVTAFDRYGRRLVVH